MPQVRFITRKWAPAVGGMETYCERLTERLARLRELELIALPGRADGRAPGAGAIVRFGLATAWRLWWAAPADVVHVADMATWPLAWVARCRQPKSRIVLSAHGSDLSFADRCGPLAALYRAYLALGARLLPKARILANSRWIAQRARLAGFRDVRVVTLGTDLRAELATEPTGAILFAGRVARGKGLRFFVEEVLPRIENPPVLRVAGTVWDEAEGAALAAPGVEWLGRLTPDRLAEEYAGALCVVVPSTAPEGFGLVAVEAAACGGVVIAADHSGLAEAAADGVGLLAPNDAAAWASLIDRVRGWTPDERGAFIARATAVVRARYDWGAVAANTLDAYEPATAISVATPRPARHLRKSSKFPGYSPRL